MNQYRLMVAGAVVTASLVLPLASQAQTLKTMPVRHPMTKHGLKNGAPKRLPPQTMVGKNVIAGTVTAVNGTNITVTGTNGTTYTIDASAARFMKRQRPQVTPPTNTPPAYTIADIAVGDHISAFGTLNGTTITATIVRDMGKIAPGIMMHRLKK